MTEPVRLGRYELLEFLGSGGMATVHLGRLATATGFSRLVAVKQLHAHLATDPLFVGMFLDEARLAARVRHAHVVPTLDVLEEEGAIAIVMDYVEGVSLTEVLNAVRERGQKLPLHIAVGIVSGILHGVHAAHEARDESGHPLCIVHRDLSPNNVLVGSDGVTRLLDFGVAKAVGRLQTTGDTGRLKGTFAYMSPEHALGTDVDRRADVYSASVVLWESLVGERLFAGKDVAVILTQILYRDTPAPSAKYSAIGPELDAIVMRGMAKDREGRFASALDMARALEGVVPPASSTEIAEWLAMTMGDVVQARRERRERLERSDVTRSRERRRAALDRAARASSKPPPMNTTPTATPTPTADVSVITELAEETRVPSPDGPGLGIPRKSHRMRVAVGVAAVATVALSFFVASTRGDAPVAPAASAVTAMPSAVITAPSVIVEAPRAPPPPPLGTPSAGASAAPAPVRTFIARPSPRASASSAEASSAENTLSAAEFDAGPTHRRPGVIPNERK